MAPEGSPTSRFRPLTEFRERPPDEMRRRADDFAALHHAGLATLTHTPSPMDFLNAVLDRPSNERPYLLLVTGYPADGARVPDIGKKPLDAIASFV